MQENQDFTVQCMLLHAVYQNVLTRFKRLLEVCQLINLKLIGVHNITSFVFFKLF